MRLVIQRVKHCSVRIDQSEQRHITEGLLVLVGIVDDDTLNDINWLVNKTLNLRIFNDDAGVMNRSVLDISGDLMIVSQFTLHASTRKGNRPSYTRASKPDTAIPLYETFVKTCRDSGLVIETGTFGADMEIELLNDGPVTILIDSKQKE